MSQPDLVAEARKVYEETNNFTKTADILSKKFGRPFSRKAVTGWLKHNSMPMSQDVTKIVDASPEECVEELCRIAALDPDKIVTRNYFRVHSKLAESAWNQHFGTFKEFKRQAGIVLSRHQHRMELDIAKHASLNRFREMTAEKRQWGDKWDKPVNSRYQSLLICNDVHDVECDPFSRAMFVETARRMQPDIVVLNGDIFDLPEFGRYNVDPREWDVISRIKWVHSFLSDIREAAPDAQIDFIEGNHEYRLLRHLAEESPAMQAVLSDLHGFTVPKLLGLEEFGVNYVAPADLGTLTKRDADAEIRRNFKIYSEQFVASHYPDARKFGFAGVSGHHHKHEMWAGFNPITGPYEWHQVACLHKREASYTMGEKWQNGFAQVYLDTVQKRTQIDHTVISDFAVIGGKWFFRNN